MHACTGIAGIGDACEVDTDSDGIADEADSDGDGVADTKDVAPWNKFIYRTDFNRHMTVTLTGSKQVNPRWQVTGNVRKLVKQV